MESHIPSQAAKPIAAAPSRMATPVGTLTLDTERDAAKIADPERSLFRRAEVRVRSAHTPGMATVSTISQIRDRLTTQPAKARIPDKC